MTFDAVLLVAGALLMLSGLVILRRSRGLAVS